MVGDELQPDYQGHLPVTVNFRHGLEPRVFTSLDGMHEWATRQVALYGQLGQVALTWGEEPLASGIHRFASVRSAADSLAAARDAFSRDDANWIGHLQTAASNLQDVFTAGGFHPVETVEGQGLLQLATLDPIGAVTAAWCLSDGTAKPGHILQVREPAIARGLAYSASLQQAVIGSGDAAAATAAIDAAIVRIQNSADAIKERADASAGVVERAEKRIVTHVEELDETASRHRDGIETTVAQKLQTAREDIDAFKVGYEQRIALQQPTQFWTDKASDHKTAAKWAAGSAVVVGLVIGVSAAIWMPDFLGTGVPSPGKIAVGIVLATLGLWLLRVLVRTYLSQQHLATDAAERVTMVKTYLALLEAKSAPADNLAPILVALFRNASDGFVKDDSMPPVIAELLTKQR